MQAAHDDDHGRSTMQAARNGGDHGRSTRCSRDCHSVSVGLCDENDGDERLLVVVLLTEAVRCDFTVAENGDEGGGCRFR
ncbi:asparagine synthase [Sesbania bispinosa]|nr:asparagine synthase [Sesbania bispinosa]